MAGQIPGPNASYILLGTVVRPHGLRGELKVRPWTERPENIRQYRRLYLAPDSAADMIACTNAGTRVSGDTVILRLLECTDRTRAEQLVGLHVWLSAADLPPAEEGEWYLHDLIGKQARTAAGEVIGIITGVVSSKAQDMFVLRNGDEEFLIPAVRAFIAAMDEQGIVLDLPPGLLEINR